MPSSISMIDQKQRLEICKGLMWDYNIDPIEVDELLRGEREMAGHYTRKTLFKKVLQNLPWFTIIELIPIEEIKNLLTEEVINSLWPECIKKDYTYVRKRLQEIISVTK